METPNEVGASLLLAMVATLFCGSCFAWHHAIQRLRRGETLLQFEPRRCVPWGLLHIIGVVLGFLVISVCVYGLFAEFANLRSNLSFEEMTTRDLGMLSLVDSISKVLVTGVTILLLVLLVGATRRDQGFDCSRLAHDLRSGFIAFLLVAPPMYLMQAILTMFWPSEHPVIQMLQDQPDPLLIIVGVVSAAVVAPLVEEYFFRVLFQGWMENLASLTGRRGDSFQAIVGYRPSRYRESPEELAPDADAESNQPLEDSPRSLPTEPSVTAAIFESSELSASNNPYQSPSFPTGDPTEPQLATTDEPALPEPGIRQQPSAWPMIISSFVFAAMHAGHGPDPFPLFLLALAMGYLYQQTHRIWPSLLLHFLVNSFSLLMLAASLLGGSE